MSERNFYNGLEMTFAPPLGWIKHESRNRCEKRNFFFLLAVGDCKRLDTSFYFIVTNVHTKLWTTGKPYCFDQIQLKTEESWFLEQFHWFAPKYLFGLHIKSFINVKKFCSTFGIGGAILPPLPLRLCACPQATTGVPLSNNKKQIDNWWWIRVWVDGYT